MDNKLAVTTQTQTSGIFCGLKTGLIVVQVLGIIGAIILIIIGSIALISYKDQGEPDNTRKYSNYIF